MRKSNEDRMCSKSKFPVWISIIAIGLVGFLILLIDYFDVLTSVGLRMSNINWERDASLISSSIVVILFVFGYLVLDRRLAEKELNKRRFAEYLLEDAYKECKEYYIYLSDNIINEYVIPKVDFNSTNDSILANLKNAPFEDVDPRIIALAEEGQYTDKEIKDYFDLKTKYRHYITMRIIAYDNPRAYSDLQRELINAIRKKTIGAIDSRVDDIAK